MHVSESTALRKPAVMPSMISNDFKVPDVFKEETKKFLEEIIKFQKNKKLKDERQRWTYFTVEEFAKSKNLSTLSKDELSILDSLVDQGYIHKSGIYYHVSNKLLAVLKLHIKQNLN